VKEDLKWIKVLAKAGKDEHGQTAFNGTMSDISAKKEEQEQFKMQNLMLEQQEEENRKFMEEMSDKQAEYEQKLEKLKGKNLLYEGTYTLEEGLTFGLDVINDQVTDDTPVNYIGFIEKLTGLGEVETFGGFISKILTDTKPDFDFAFKKHVEENFPNNFIWSDKDWHIKIKLIKESDKLVKLIGIVKSDGSFNKNVEKEKTQEAKVGGIRFTFDRRNGSITTNVFGEDIIEVLSLGSNEISFDKIQSCLLVNKEGLSFATFIKQSFELEDTQELTWQGIWQKENSSEAVPIKMKILNRDANEKVSIMAVLISY
jgi:hypothetical protein